MTKNAKAMALALHNATVIKGLEYILQRLLWQVKPDPGGKMDKFARFRDH
jgi:hypothetical protein